jgi:hypothetical protein
MILTPIPPDRLPAALALFARGLEEPLARIVFPRIAVPSQAERARGAAAEAHHRNALRVAASFGMATLPIAPTVDYGWDGRALRTLTEAYVLLHEVAHFQLAEPGRRHAIDFGLGPGEETGDRASAEQGARLFGPEREQEEAMASLLGILWEVELGHPALASFLDQNWLEGIGRPGCTDHFQAILGRLWAGGFVDRDGRPTHALRQAPVHPVEVSRSEAAG